MVRLNFKFGFITIHLINILKFMKPFFLLAFISLFTFFNSIVYTQTIEKNIKVNANNGVLDGSLTYTNNKNNLAIIIAGSGPTDRNGNSTAGINTNSYKLLATELQKNNIAAIRYDKRGVGKSEFINNDESKLSFEDFINDAILLYQYAKDSLQYNNVFFIGHSEGSLIGIIASQRTNVKYYISLSGAGRPIDEVILNQLESQSPMVYNVAKDIFTILKLGKTSNDVPQYLYSLFRPSVQPYLISWLKYNPADEIKKLKIPVLIINGSCDIQTKPSEAQLLFMANNKNKLLIINKMTHTLKTTTEDCSEGGLETYSNENLPINSELINSIVTFITQ